MTTHYEAPKGGLSKDQIVCYSKITRVANPDGVVSAVVIQNGGTFTVKRPDGKNVTFRDDDQLRRAAVDVPGEETIFVYETPPSLPYKKTPIESLGTVDYRGNGANQPSDSGITGRRFFRDRGGFLR